MQTLIYSYLLGYPKQLQIQKSQIVIYYYARCTTGPVERITNNNFCMHRRIYKYWKQERTNIEQLDLTTLKLKLQSNP